MIAQALKRWVDLNQEIDTLYTVLAQLKEERAVLEVRTIPELVGKAGKIEMDGYSIPAYKFIEVLASGSARELVKAMANRMAPGGETGSGDDLVQIAQDTGFGGAITKNTDYPVF